MWLEDPSSMAADAAGFDKALKEIMEQFVDDISDEDSKDHGASKLCLCAHDHG